MPGASDYTHVYEQTNPVFVVTVDCSATSAIDTHRYSSLLRLRRILASVNRLTGNCQNIRERERENTRELLIDELKATEIQFIKYAQRTEFKDEWIALSRKKPLSSSSKLIGLQPKLDEDGMMRSDGRLKRSKFLSFDVHYPVSLPRKSWVPKLRVKEFHEKGKHASGTNHTLAELLARYWIVSGREVIRE